MTELTALNFKGEKKQLDLDNLICTIELQQRDLSDPHDVHDFDALTKDVAEAVKDKEDIEPILVIDIPDGTVKVIDGKPVKPGLYVVEGHRRVKGFKAAGRSKINAIVRKGTWEDAIMVSVSANIGNKAIPRKPQDKRRAVETSLTYFWDMSNRWHAEHCDVSQELVAKTRPSAEKLYRMYSDSKPAETDENGQPLKATRISKSGKRQAATKKPVKKKATKLIDLVDWSVWETRLGSLIKFVDDAAEKTGTVTKDKSSNYQKSLATLHAHHKVVKAWMEEIKKMPKEPATAKGE